MRKQLIAYLLLGLLAFILFLVWTFPADRAAALLHQRLPQLQLAGVSGTAWSGRAATVQYQNQRLTRCKWQFQPLALFKGRLGFAIAFDGEGRSGSANVGLRPNGSVVATAIDARLPLAELAPLLGIPVSLNGLAEIKLEELAFATGVIQRAEGDINWRQIAITEPVMQKFGDFSARFTTEESGIKAQFRDQGGPLQLEGTLRLSGGNYQFSARAVVRDPQQTLLRQALQAVGRQEADGRVALEYNGHL